MQLILWESYQLNPLMCTIAFIHRIKDEFDVSEIFGLDFYMTWLRCFLVLVDSLVQTIDTGQWNSQIVIKERWNLSGLQFPISSPLHW